MRYRISELQRLWPIAKRRICSSIVACVHRVFSNEKILKNVFGKRSGKRVLLCHLPEAFKFRQLPKYHSNFTECHVIARCFDRLGYIVDCSSRAKTGIDYSPYDIVCGINGNAYMGSFSSDAGINPLRIFYSVGAETCFNYRCTSMRNIEFRERHGHWLLGANRYIPGDPRNYYEARFSDAVICLGDSYVLRQFLNEECDATMYHQLSAFYFKVVDEAADKDFVACRRNILWFGSSGMLHKGLDIAIDFAVSHPEFTLHICGGSRQESDFWRYYGPVIESHDNIVMHGFVDIESKEYAAVLSQCGILLNPSVSEGGAVSVLNVLGNAPMFPVYSKGTGLDLSAVGVEVANVAYRDFEEALLAVDSLSPGEFSRKAWAAYHTVRDNYTLEKYEEGMYNCLKGIIDKNR